MSDLAEPTAWYLKWEEILRPSAARSTDGDLTRREHHEPDNRGYRTAFQHDRDRIVHSRVLRRLQQKTQVVPSWTSDHVRTRLTHTMEVSQLARSIGAALGLNLYLIEAIALGHDVGHTPFGHGGEQTLHRIMSGHDDLDGDLAGLIRRTRGTQRNRPALFGGFKHNWNSLRLLAGENRYSGFSGLNLTSAAREGILKHTRVTSRLSPEQVWDDDLHFDFDIEKPLRTLEAQTVALSDEIAQATHDLEDGFRTGIVKIDEFAPRREIFQLAGIDTDMNGIAASGPQVSMMIRALIGCIVNDVIEESETRISAFEATNSPLLPTEPLISFSESLAEPFKDLHDALHDKFVNSGYVNRSDQKARFFIRRLFQAYWNQPLQLPDFMLRRYSETTQKTYLRQVDLEDAEKEIDAYHDDPRFLRTICDHVAAMSDRYVLAEYAELYEPNTHGQHHPEGFR